MTAPLPMPAIASAAPAQIAATPGAKPAAAPTENGPSFSEVLTQRYPGPSANAQQPADNAGTPAADVKPAIDTVSNTEEVAASAIDDATQTAAGALAVAAAQQPVTPVMLPQQTLDIAAQAAEQVQRTRGAAPAAVSNNTAIARAALTTASHDASAAPRMPAPVATPQTEAAAAPASRDAQTTQTQITVALKSGSAPAAEDAIVLDQAPAAITITPRAPEPVAQSHAAPSRAAAELKPRAEPRARGEEAPAALALSPAPQLPSPQHAANAQDPLAPASAAATQRQQPAPILNPASIAMPNMPNMSNMSMTLQVATPVGTPRWGAELGQQMVVMSHNLRQGTQTAELRLDPPDLGPLRVSLNLADGVASASFVSAHASVRQAIEIAIPQLQQALAQAGISLGQTNVGEQAAQQEFARQHNSGSPRQGSGHDTAPANGPVNDALPNSAAIVRNANALIDTFA